VSTAQPLYVRLALLVLAAVLPATWLAFHYWGAAGAQVPPIQLELFKGLAQFVSIGFVGTIVAGVLRRVEERRAMEEKKLQDQKQAAEEANRKAREMADRVLEEERRSAVAVLEAQAVQRTRDFEFIREVSYDILDAYNEIKLVRRMLRAAARLDDTMCKIPDSAYRELCLRLEHAQIALEGLKKRIRSSQDRFVVAGGTETFFDKLQRSEQYVRDILREFENQEHALDQDVRVIVRDSLMYGFVAEKSSIERLNLPLNAWVRFFQPMDEIEDAVAALSAASTISSPLPVAPGSCGALHGVNVALG
jgi:hypothetical protein